MAKEKPKKVPAKAKPKPQPKPKKKPAPKKQSTIQKKQSQVQSNSRISQVRKKTQKAQFMPVFRMWLNTFLSMFRADSGTIPRDIGENIYIGENVYITKNYMSSMLVIEQHSLDTPLAYTSELVHYVKQLVPSAIIDVSLKLAKHEFDFTDTSMAVRAKMWQDKLDDPKIKERIKNRMAWMLYSYDVLKTGKLAYTTRVFITLRAKNNDTLQRAIKAARSYFNEYDIEVRQIKSNLIHYLNYENPVISAIKTTITDIPNQIATASTIGEILPVTQGLNDEIGLLLGIDRYSENPYIIDLKATARAKNFYVLGPSGEGKTFLVLTWLLDAFTSDFRMSITDIKGNEFTEFTKLCNGTIISMKPGSTFFVNTFKLNKNALQPGQDPLLYFNEMVRTSKQILMMVINPKEHMVTKASAFMEEFLSALYLMVGVVSTNVNTWERSMDLTPFKVYEYFLRFLSPEIREVYHDIIDDTLLNFNTYLSPNGSGADLFRKEMQITDILDSRVVTFDYGMLGSTRVTDEVSLNLKHFFAKLITDAYVAHNKDLKLHTIRVLEESQMTNAVLREMYAEEISLRRAQNQINILLGNSISGLKGDRNSEIILENINIWVMGRLTKKNLDYVTEEYGMEDFVEQLEEINTNIDYDRTFLVVNKLHRKTTSSMIRAFVPTSVAQSQVFQVVDATQTEGV